ncbi:NAD-dependent succinate-semialdehyde dehydrogenase [Kiloniella laminariae]|uniref:NAD-dependent succinate-semialdehyde dehydrogenase n=1 Tax=Kiloniella laminariae TaxID=454162 RepID=A0ABT4LHQ6_9PROT|nr:NAD-dependent succinate-semialdehyde dehydrogenase [Kiloniella laminariae]MCZ4280638.1 NAD-dependent succinate-semialdehyde dehydrogenase [Kiloniella laminariae]
MSVPLKDESLFRQQAFINGKWIDADSGRKVPVYDPATGKEVGMMPWMGAAETRRAIEAAERAFSLWRKRTAKERAAVLRRWRDLILLHQDDLAQIMTAEQGKPLAEARGEIVSSAGYIEWFAEEAKRTYGETIPAGNSGQQLLTIRQPIGVVAAITPWNFPIQMIARKCAPALAAGCAVVMKPAPQTPFSALALADLGQRAGLPDGLFNIVTGKAGEIGDEMTSNHIVRKLSFTGSTVVGKVLMEKCALTVKQVSMELGGNAPFIVFDDADLDRAVNHVIASKFRNAGQTCVCANRIMVQKGVYDDFARRLSERVRGLKIGPGTEDGVFLGPLIDDRAIDKVDDLVKDALSKGAKAPVGGAPLKELGAQFYAPTVLTDVTQNMQVFHKEIFGPVAPLYCFESEEEAVSLANATRYGLAAYFFSQDVGRVWRVSEALEYGMVGANSGTLSSEATPFGGIKESGIGREGGKYGIQEYLEIKYINMGFDA